MLKTLKNEKLWLVTQPDHAQVAGYLAAHWGNDDFVRPGYFASASDPEQLRAETVMAVAQHDNGWWEWEATPELAAVDGFPSGLADVLKNQQEGMNRWRLGLGRFDNAPYANLLISHHAYWLYAVGTQSDPDPAFVHPLFWNRSSGELYSGHRKQELDFLAELEELQKQWVEVIRRDAATASWVEPENLHPHARLLQLLDGVSLSLCSALIPASSGESRGLGEDEFELRDVPRRSWGDRVTIQVTPVGERRIALSPYPFDQDPLTVSVLARVFDLPADRSGHFQTWWHAKPLEVIQFQYSSSA